MPPITRRAAISKFINTTCNTLQNVSHLEASSNSGTTVEFLHHAHCQEENTHTHTPTQQSLFLNLHTHQLLFLSHPHYIATVALLQPAHTHQLLFLSHPQYIATVTLLQPAHTHQLLFLSHPQYIATVALLQPAHTPVVVIFITPTLHCSSCSSWTCTQTTRLFFITPIPKVPGNSNLLTCWWIFNSVSFFLTLFLKKKK